MAAQGDERKALRESVTEMSSGDEPQSAKELSKIRQRQANVYDAVAGTMIIGNAQRIISNHSIGRVTQAGLIGNVLDAKASKQPLRPDEVLFKQANAPLRYEETDQYYAHRNLSPDQQLPSGDLLSATHAYISKLYSRTHEHGAQSAWKCMDETALIAFGILIEETARELLGETGDFAFTEAAEEEKNEDAAPSDEEDAENVKRSASMADKERSTSWSSSSDGSRYSTDESD